MGLELTPGLMTLVRLITGTPFEQKLATRKSHGDQRVLLADFGIIDTGNQGSVTLFKEIG